MEEISHLRDVLCTAVKDNGDGSFSGGVVEPDGSPVGVAEHRRIWGEDCQTGLAFPTVYQEILSSGYQLVEEDCLYGGISFNHYGHFLVESLGRLWACNRARYATYPIYFHSLWGEFETDGFPGSLLRSIGIDPDRVRVITEPIVFRALHVPVQQCGFHLLEKYDRKPGPDFVAFIEEAEKAINARLANKSTHEKVYVSRSELSFWNGRIVGEKAFETFLKAHGWHVIYPELMSPEEQLSLYVNAKKVLFAEGSAPHTSLLLPNWSADIAILARRPNWWGERTCRASYFEMKNEVLWVGALDKFYTLGMHADGALSLIDLRAVTCDLVAHGFLDVAFDEWPTLKDDALLRDLADFVTAIREDRSFLRYLADLPT